MKHLAPLLAALLLLAACGSSDRPEGAPAPVADNRALAALFNADQKARKDGRLDLVEVMADAERLAEVRAMLKRGEVRSGEDFLRAGLLFQHSFQTDDYLLAHALATAALSQGEERGARLAAASLDRYLLATGRRQIYGTQFVQIGSEPTRQLALDRDLLTDAIREATLVPPLAEQTPPPKP
ncbi:hypothetical protein [Brevundimonas sp.]|uniref:hypothetical protein n=1 Tax=Brevundimonas sp. TaxID=1871086 RepID=UPI003D6D6E7D